MNVKQKLNNEIILCRGAVRKAKVDVTRKILKTMKILKSCKNEKLKEKKLRKSERLFQKVQIIKKLKLDNVTKFALMNDLKNYTPSDNNEENVMALLGKYKSIAQKVEKIKAQFVDWKREIPALLDAMAQKRLAKKYGQHSVKKAECVKSEDFKPNNENSEVDTEEANNNNENIIQERINNGIDKIVKEEKPDFRIDKQPVKLRTTSESSEDVKKRKKTVKAELPEVKIEKIVDPFFIGKEMVAPKLLSEDVSESTEEKPLRNTFCGKITSQKTPPSKKKDLRKNGFKAKEPDKEEKLHPSWAAKKVQLIKPFEGKKIKFSED